MSPLVQTLLFLAIATGLWGGIHVYLWRRVVRPLELSEAARRRARAALVAGAALVPAVFTGSRAAGMASWAQPLLWAGYVYAGLVATAFPLLLARDAALLPLRPLTPSPERRRLLLRATSSAALAASAALSAYGVWRARRGPEIVRVKVPLPGLPPAFEGYRIAQLTDTHVGLTITGAFIEPVVEAVNGLGADLIAVTGDLIDGTVDQLREHVAPLARLAARDGVYFVTGNHEYFYDAPAWCSEVARLGMVVLNESHRVVERGGARLLVAGVTDPSGSRFVPAHRCSPPAALAGAPDCDVKLLLSHQPKSIGAAAEAGFHLQLSGHTHGGQFFPWTVLIELVWRWGPGLHLVGGTHLYVSRGTCYWGPPMRSGDGSPSEITLLELVRA